MAQWSAKRRFVYGGGFILILALIVVSVGYLVFYKTPTCSDGKQNGIETGVDCGGSCTLLCTNDALAPIVHWSKIFNVSGNVYTAVAFVENPNINSKNAKATYQFKIYDAQNRLIGTKVGYTSIPKNKKFAIFEVGIVLKDSKPKSADFAFTSFSAWEKDNTKEPDISIRNSALLATTTIPRITGTVSNNSVTTIPSLELSVFVLDNKENALAVSHTFVDTLKGHSTQDFVFTWPKPFDFGTEDCPLGRSIATSTDTMATSTESLLCAKVPSSIVIISRPI